MNSATLSLFPILVLLDPKKFCAMQHNSYFGALQQNSPANLKYKFFKIQSVMGSEVNSHDGLSDTGGLWLPLNLGQIVFNDFHRLAFSLHGSQGEMAP